MYIPEFWCGVIVGVLGLIVLAIAIDRIKCVRKKRR